MAERKALKEMQIELLMGGRVSRNKLLTVPVLRAFTLRK